MEKLLIIFFFLPLMAFGQTKTVNPADSVNKYRKLAARDRDSLIKYEKNPGWNVHYFVLSEKRRSQMKYWMDIKAIDDQKRRGKP